MKRISTILVFAGALALTASCGKEYNPGKDNKPVKQIEVTVIASDKPVIADVDSKTFIDGTAVKWSTENEKIKVFEAANLVAGGVEYQAKTSAVGTTNDSGATMSFGVELDEKTPVANYSAFDYYAFYPGAAYQTPSNNSSININNVAINTKAAQTPSSTNFDASADLLIAKKVENGASQASTLQMQFARLVAVGKMTIKNLESSDYITKIHFSAKEGTGELATPVVLAGRTAFNLETAHPVSSFGSNAKEYEIILDYTGKEITANSSTGMVAYFFCYPFAINAENPGSFKVVVETATQQFTKEVSVSSAKGLAFITGKSSTFYVDMDNVAGETKAVDLPYAYLDYADYAGAGGGNSYGNITVNKTHGDSWVTYACTNNGAIGVRRNDNGTNDSYIKLPDFEDDIQTVIVHFKSITASKSITLETSATGTDGSIASLATTEALDYTFDLSSASVKTAYFRSNGFQSLISKIEVYAGTDTRAAYAAPATVSAALNTDDTDVTNSIDVSWSTVTDASGYVITLHPTSGDDVVVKAASSPYTVTDLSYQTAYTISVQAEPADYYINKISAATSAASAVTTGEQVGTTVYYNKVTAAPTSGDWSGQYLIVNGSSAANGTITSKWLKFNTVTVVNDAIESTQTVDGIAVTIAKVTGQSYYTIQFANGNYLGSTSSNDGIKVASSVGADFYWSFTFADNLVKIILGTSSEGTRHLRLNGNSGFRTYTSATGAQATLYKLDDSGNSGSGGGNNNNTPEPIVINKDTQNLPTAYGSGSNEYTLNGYKFQIEQVYVNGTKLQWRAAGNSNGTGTLYNTDAMPAGIASIVIVYDSSDSNKNHTVQIGSSANPSSATAITPSTDSNTYTYAGDGSSTYFVITNGSGAGYITSITINFN